MSRKTRPQVLIVGSGFGGLFAAKRLAKEAVDITIVSDTSHHLFQPLLYQVATGILSEGTIAPSTRDILARQKNVTTYLGRVTDIDVENRVATSTSFAQQRTYSYDYLIVAAGAGQSYFGNDHYARFAPGMKSIDDALELRSRIFNAFELAEIAASQGRTKDVERLLTFVVVGAGPTGVEMAGQIAELSRRTLNDEFRHINPTNTTVILAEGADHVLPSFGDSLGDNAREVLEDLGVQVRLGAMVVDVDESGVTMRDADGTKERVLAATKIWAAGVSASPLGKLLADQTGAEIDRAGRVKVLDDLTLPDHSEIAILGDMISLKDYPGVAPLAIQTAQFAADNIAADMGGKPRESTFEYRDKGSMATISRFKAVASVGNLKLTGSVAWLAWLGLHLVYIVGFKNQVSTILSWAATFTGDARGERANTGRQAVSRLSLQELTSDQRSRAYSTLTGKDS